MWKLRNLLFPGYLLLALLVIFSAAGRLENGLWVLPGMALYIMGLIFLGRYYKRLKKADYERRLRPVREALETRWQMTGSEKDYQRELLQHLFYQLSLIPKPESPLPSGTRVDAYLEHGNEDWYITIKRGLSNQKRLILQGEIEDIILHAPNNKRDLWIFVIVGLGPEEDPNEMAQLDHLLNYAVHRSLVNGRSNEPRAGAPSVNIELMPAIIVPKSLSDEPTEEGPAV